MSVQYYEGIGRRKESSARVRVMTGTGRFIVNDKPAEAYFTRIGDMETIMAPVTAAGQERSTLDITVVVHGGGVTGQAGALRHGIARALLEAGDEYRGELKKAGLLRRDPRMVERKKYGLKKARKRPQFSKR